MEQILWEFRYVITFLVAALVYGAFNWKTVKTQAYKGMLQAKSLAKDCILQSGQAQEDWVVSTIWPLLPLPARLVLSQEAFRRIVRSLYKTAKDFLDDGKLNGSIPSTPEEARHE